MNEPSDVREMLIAEAIGDAGRLLLKFEALTPALLGSMQALQQANDQVHETLDGFERRMGDLAENAKAVTAKHIARKLDEAARNAAERHTQALQDAGLSFFRGDFGKALARLEMAAQRIAVESHRRRTDWWMQVCSHMLTAAVASIVTLSLAIWCLPR